MPILKRYLLLFAVPWLIAMMASVSIANASDLSPKQIREAHQSGEIKSLRWVLEQIQLQFPGQVLDAELTKKKYKNNHKYNHRYVYKIKLISEDGHISKLYVDANTAELLRVKSRDKKRKQYKGKE